LTRRRSWLLGGRRQHGYYVPAERAKESPDELPFPSICNDDIELRAAYLQGSVARKRKKRGSGHREDRKRERYERDMQRVMPVLL
jgi:hypothetical protein